MTKYFLIGGYISDAKDGGKSFYETFVKDLPSNPVILICAFARKREQWAESFEERKRFFQRFSLRKDLVFDNAESEIFSDQAKRAHAIFFMGGDLELRLLQSIQKDVSWTRHLENKNIAGTSAGADILSQYYYDITDGTIKEGLGLAKVKVIPHFESTEYKVDWQQAKAKLENFHPELPTWCLREGEFKETRNS